jgi:hypothetical protein
LRASDAPGSAKEAAIKRKMPPSMVAYEVYRCHHASRGFGKNGSEWHAYSVKPPPISAR